MHKQLDELSDQSSKLTNETLELLFDTAMVNPPWELEEWAKRIMDKYKVPGIARHMAFRYLDYVEFLINDSSAGQASFSTRLNYQRAPTSPLHYWNEAMRWKKVLDDFYLNTLELDTTSGKVALRESEDQRLVRERMEKIGPALEVYK
jgi:hypothetical protein